MFTHKVMQRPSQGSKRLLLVLAKCQALMTKQIEQNYLGPDRLLKEVKMSWSATESKIYLLAGLAPQVSHFINAQEQLFKAKLVLCCESSRNLS